MSDDLVKRLRESRTMWENARGVPSDLEREAADTIAALTARAERAEAALATARVGALEEAARVAIAYDEPLHSNQAVAINAASNIAAAIRAMKGDTA